MRKLYFICAPAIFLAAVFVGTPAFGQEKGVAAAKGPESATPVAEAEKEEAVQPDNLSIYGEVQAVNAEGNTLSVQYYNYDSDEEKTMDVVANKDTKMENAAALGEIKKGDWVDVTYVTSEGKNVAKTIIVEKEETPAAEEAAAAPSSESAAPAEE